MPKAKIEIHGKKFKVDLDQPMDISIAVQDQGMTAWWIPAASIAPVQLDNYTGSVAQGGAANFNNVKFNPHSHGTHTECIGHITEEFHSINNVLKRNWFHARLITIKPNTHSNDDTIITKEQVKKALGDQIPEAVIIRTLPNETPAIDKSYSHTNPTYMQWEVADCLRKKNVKHLLIDQPSIDREEDEGALAGHKAFWNFHGEQRLDATITELIHVPTTIQDGDYLLNLQVAAFENDAAPSRPLLYRIID